AAGGGEAQQAHRDRHGHRDRGGRRRRHGGGPADVFEHPDQAGRTEFGLGAGQHQRGAVEHGGEDRLHQERHRVQGRRHSGVQRGAGRQAVHRGDVVFTALTSKAPYTTFSFQYLAGKNYFNNTNCHRLTTSSIYVLQCGDPTGTGSGGPGYQFQDENLNYFGAAGSSGTVTYKAGTVAMANSGPGTNGSQFFLVYKDSPLGPNYTPFGTITKGLDILQSIAAQGSDNANGTGDGKPKETVTIQSVSIS